MASKKQSKKKFSAEWYLLIDDRKEGPYTIVELKNHKKFTPDTLVWKKGFPRWIPARFVFELEIVFEDEREEPIEEDVFKKDSWNLRGERDTLALQQDPFPFFLWVLLFILIALYILYLTQEQ